MGEILFGGGNPTVGPTMEFYLGDMNRRDYSRLFLLKPPGFLRYLCDKPITDFCNFNHVLEMPLIERRVQPPDEILEEISKPYSHMVGEIINSHKDPVKINVEDITEQANSRREEIDAWDRWLSDMIEYDVERAVLHHKIGQLEKLAESWEIPCK